MTKETIIKRLKRTPVVVAIFFTVLSAHIYFSTAHSEEYQTAVRYVEASERVQTEIGAIKDISLSLMGISTRYSGTDSGSAKFKLNVKGTKANARIQFYMLKRDGVWQVKKMVFVNKKDV